MAGLSNIERTDLEMLHIIKKACGQEEYTSAVQIAAELGIFATDDDPRGARRVVPRLSWMKRYGMLFTVDPQNVNRDSKDGKLWGITAAGSRLMEGRLRKNLADAIEADDPGSHLLMMRKLSQRTIVNGDQTTAAAVRREYLHHNAQRVRW
jgi:hypothetical protein